jgi:type VI secretion system secreted protein Hcp
VSRSRRPSRIDRRTHDGNGVPQLFALQSAIGNRASAALMREAATSSSSAAPAVRRGQKHAYITIEGTKQGKFKGSSNIKGREDAIEIQSYRLGVSAPRDVSTGQASGKRQYQAISFKKPVDASSPQFMTALTTNEVLKTVKIEFYGPDNHSGEERVYQTVTLTNASLKSWTQDFENESGGGDDLELVELVFEKITLESNTAKTSAQDDWAPPQT